MPDDSRSHSSPVGAGGRRVSGRELSALHAEAYRWALHLSDYNSTEAEEMVQTAYLRILDGSARFRGEAALKTWLFGIIRNVVRETRRKRYREVPLDESYAANILGSEGVDDPTENRRIKTAIAQLPARQREVALLVFFRDLSIAEAAEVLGLTLGTARTHYERAKQNLAKELKDLIDEND